VHEALWLSPNRPKQNITGRLDRRTLRKAKVLAAKRNTSISGLLAAQIERSSARTTPTNRPIDEPSHTSNRGFPSAAGSSRPVTSGMSDRTFVDSNVLIVG
jgi:hypothetical protein